MRAHNARRNAPQQHSRLSDFKGHLSTDVIAEPGKDGSFPVHAALSIGPSSVLVFSRRLNERVLE